MATRASAAWQDYMNESCHMPDYPSAVNSGIVGDSNHRSGYHLSIEDCAEDDYSVTQVDDAAPPGGWRRDLASAGDKSMNTTDMIREWYRYEAVWLNPNDPRRGFLRAYNGWNGVGAAERIDFVSGTRKVTSADHKWHSHREVRRRYAEDPAAFAALLSIERGESVETYLAGGGSGPIVQPPETNYPAWPGRYFRYQEGWTARQRVQGADVEQWQDRMKYRGWAITVDGDYGRKSKAICIQFQQEKGLDPDGIVGPVTWAAAWTMPVT